MIRKKKIYASLLLSILLTAMMHSVLPHVHHSHKTEVEAVSDSHNHNHSHDNSHHHNLAQELFDLLLDVHSHSGHVFYFAEEVTTYLTKKQNLVSEFLFDSSSFEIRAPEINSISLKPSNEVIRSDHYYSTCSYRGPPSIG